MTAKRSSGTSLERAALRPTCLAFSLLLTAPVEANEDKTVSSPAGSERVAARAEKRERHAHLKPESRLVEPAWRSNTANIKTSAIASV
ncbi:hypothetical protein G6N74_16515 [Mesorhizobium sp. CGMCC 1.15528]|uniref:Uncharacterized protein n=1 Tax=Mesorhizobium zhangyense TaxID=1776730 RepID=A0A7C9R8D1_9HYPH|nr:hypothetical protein [Mesorhizobium zhangyense]NGN42674.1 hypothetical protein [Mesorhizobium zhangyense]